MFPVMSQPRANALLALMFASLHGRQQQTESAASKASQPCGTKKKNGKMHLDQRAARLVYRRLEAAEAWIIVKGMTGTPDDERNGLAAWRRLLLAVCPEFNPDEHECEQVIETGEQVCEMPDGSIISIADLPDSYALVTVTAANGRPGPRTIGGKAAPIPKAVLVQGEHAATRRDVMDVLAELGDETHQGEAEDDFGNFARRRRKGEEPQEQRLGRAARPVRSQRARA